MSARNVRLMLVFRLQAPNSRQAGDLYEQNDDPDREDALCKADYHPASQIEATEHAGVHRGPQSRPDRRARGLANQRQPQQPSSGQERSHRLVDLRQRSVQPARGQERHHEARGCSNEPEQLREEAGPRTQGHGRGEDRERSQVDEVHAGRVLSVLLVDEALLQAERR